MFKFDKEQIEFKIGDIIIGGQPGKNPTVLIGSLFYEHHSLVADHKLGVFNKIAVENLIKKQEELSDLTGNPVILDIMGLYPEALINYIKFITEITDSPFLLDGISAEVRILALKYVSEVGLLERAVYNSIEMTASDTELQAIKDSGIKAAVLLAFSPIAVFPQAKLELIKGSDNQAGLLDKAKRAGVEKTLIDTVVLDLPSIGLSAQTIHLVKKELGLPTGNSPANAIYTWDKGKIFEKKDFASISAAVLSQAFGADFIIYGSIHKADYIFPALAVSNACISYNALRYFNIKLSAGNQPLYKIG